MRFTVRRARRGTSLVQLALVLGLIAAVGIGSLALFGTRVREMYVDSNETLRDEQRKTDLAVLAAAVELYRQRFGSYPAGSAGSDRACWFNNETSDAGCNPLAPLLTSGILTRLPYDPAANFYVEPIGDVPDWGVLTGCGVPQFYSYWSDGSGYLLGAPMERQGRTGCVAGMWSGPTAASSHQYVLKRNLP